jgi:hypothetical protein
MSLIETEVMMNFINNTPHNTSDLAQLALAFAHLNEEQRAVVERCINNYSEKDGIVGAVLRQIYLLLEAYRKNYGTSDWEQAQKVLEDKAFTVLPKFTKSWIGQHRIDSATNRALQGLVRLNESEIELPPGITPFVAKNCNVDVIVDTAKAIAKELILGDKSVVKAAFEGCKGKVTAMAEAKVKEVTDLAVNKMINIAKACAEQAMKNIVGNVLPSFASV